MVTTATPAAPALPDSAHWVRPWFTGGVDVWLTGRNNGCTITGHIYADCEELARWDVTPTEGAGWLDPRGDDTCPCCLHRFDPQLYAQVFPEDD